MACRFATTANEYHGWECREIKAEWIRFVKEHYLEV